jgi:hypothetical protein
VNKTRNKNEIWLTCAVVSGVEIIDELLGVVEVLVVKGVDEDVRVDDTVEGA